MPSFPLVSQNPVIQPLAKSLHFARFFGPRPVFRAPRPVSQAVLQILSSIIFCKIRHPPFAPVMAFLPFPHKDTAALHPFSSSGHAATPPS
jgi:hypothetical protein